MRNIAPILCAGAALAALLATAAAARALDAVRLPVDPGRTIEGQPAFFTTRTGSVVAEYRTGDAGATQAHFFDLASGREILANEAGGIGDAPRALHALTQREGWSPLRPSVRATSGGTVAALDEIDGTSCRWVYGSVVTFTASDGKHLGSAAVFAPSDGAPVAVRRDCEQTTGEVRLRPRWRDVAPALVALPNGGGFLAAFAGLPVLIAFDAAGRPLGVGGAAPLVVTPGTVVTASFEAANRLGASPQLVLDRTDQRISTFRSGAN